MSKANPTQYMRDEYRRTLNGSEYIAVKKIEAARIIAMSLSLEPCAIGEVLALARRSSNMAAAMGLSSMFFAACAG